MYHLGCIALLFSREPCVERGSLNPDCMPCPRARLSALHHIAHVLLVTIPLHSGPPLLHHFLGSNSRPRLLLYDVRANLPYLGQAWASVMIILRKNMRKLETTTSQYSSKRIHAQQGRQEARRLWIRNWEEGFLRLHLLCRYFEGDKRDDCLMPRHR